MVLFLLGASGNTEEKTQSETASYEGMRRTYDGQAVETHTDIQTAEPEEEEAEKPEAEEACTQQAELALEEVPEEPKETEPERVIDLSEEDYTALLKIVEAEAGGEDLKGKMLVANVVINRLNHGAFGSSIKEVVYQRVNGRAQFSPVANGQIDRVTVSSETVEAVERVLCGEDESCGALYFVARAYADADNMAWFDRNLTRLFEYKGHEFFA